MNHDELLVLIKSLNNAQLGSFGEHLAIDYYKNRVPHAKVHAVRRDTRDLIIEGSGDDVVRAVDVKAHKFIDAILCADKLNPYYAERKPGVDYEQVFFFSDGAVLVGPFYSRRENAVVLKQWSMAALAEEYSVWRKDGYENKSSEDKFIEPALVGDKIGPKGLKINTEIVAWYQDSFPALKPCRTLYRGPDNPKMFSRRDLPHNLPGSLSAVGKSSATIFVQAERVSQEINEVEFIVAYPNSYLKKLPLAEGSKMAKQKGYEWVLDLPLVLYSYRECTFQDVDDLMSKFKGRFEKYLKL